MLIMFAFDSGQNRNAEFPVGGVNMCVTRDVTNDVSVLKKN